MMTQRFLVNVCHKGLSHGSTMTRTESSAMKSQLSLSFENRETHTVQPCERGNVSTHCKALTF